MASFGEEVDVVIHQLDTLIQHGNIEPAKYAASIEMLIHWLDNIDTFQYLYHIFTQDLGYGEKFEELFPSAGEQKLGIVPSVDQKYPHVLPFLLEVDKNCKLLNTMRIWHLACTIKGLTESDAGATFNNISCSISLGYKLSLDLVAAVSRKDIGEQALLHLNILPSIIELGHSCMHMDRNVVSSYYRMLLVAVLGHMFNPNLHQCLVDCLDAEGHHLSDKRLTAKDGGQISNKWQELFYDYSYSLTDDDLYNNHLPSIFDIYLRLMIFSDSPDKICSDQSFFSDSDGVWPSIFHDVKLEVYLPATVEIFLSMKRWTHNLLSSIQGSNSTSKSLFDMLSHALCPLAQQLMCLALSGNNILEQLRSYDHPDSDHNYIDAINNIVSKTTRRYINDLHMWSPADEYTTERNVHGDHNTSFFNVKTPIGVSKSISSEEYTNSNAPISPISPLRPISYMGPLSPMNSAHFEFLFQAVEDNDDKNFFGSTQWCQTFHSVISIMEFQTRSTEGLEIFNFPSSANTRYINSSCYTPPISMSVLLCHLIYNVSVAIQKQYYSLYEPTAREKSLFTVNVPPSAKLWSDKGEWQEDLLSPSKHEDENIVIIKAKKELELDLMLLAMVLRRNVLLKQEVVFHQDQYETVQSHDDITSYLEYCLRNSDDIDLLVGTAVLAADTIDHTIVPAEHGMSLTKYILYETLMIASKRNKTLGIQITLAKVFEHCSDSIFYGKISQEILMHFVTRTDLTNWKETSPNLPSVISQFISRWYSYGYSFGLKDLTERLNTKLPLDMLAQILTYQDSHQDFHMEGLERLEVNLGCGPDSSQQINLAQFALVLSSRDSISNELHFKEASYPGSRSSMRIQSTSSTT